jgi:hypothetical protein
MPERPPVGGATRRKCERPAAATVALTDDRTALLDLAKERIPARRYGLHEREAPFLALQVVRRPRLAGRRSGSNAHRSGRRSPGTRA